jgi:hypothetical protein
MATMDDQARRDAMADAETMPDDLKLRCPDCARQLRVPLMRHATVHARRKCRGCKMRWFLVVTPLAASHRGVAIHKLEWTPEWMIHAARRAVPGLREE